MKKESSMASLIKLKTVGTASSGEEKRMRLAVVGIFLAVCCLATSGIFVKFSLIDPIATGAWRIALAMPLMLMWQLRDRRRSSEQSRPPLSLKKIGTFWFAGTFLGMDLTFWNVSFSYTTVANANLLASLAPFVVVPAAWFLYRERISLSFIAGLLLSTSGIVILLSGRMAAPQSGEFFGDALAAITTLFYAVYLLMISRCRRNSSSAAIMYWTGFGSLSVLIPFAFLFEDRLFPQSVADFWPLIGLALVAHVGGQGLLAQCLRYVPASLASMLVILQTVVATIYAWVLFGEALGPVELLGIAVCLVGIYFAKRGKAGPKSI